jgi:hypothetical protein
MSQPPPHIFVNHNTHMLHNLPTNIRTNIIGYIANTHVEKILLALACCIWSQGELLTPSQHQQTTPSTTVAVLKTNIKRMGLGCNANKPILVEKWARVCRMPHPLRHMMLLRGGGADDDDYVVLSAGDVATRLMHALTINTICGFKLRRVDIDIVCEFICRRLSSPMIGDDCTWRMVLANRLHHTCWGCGYHRCTSQEMTMSDGRYRLCSGCQGSDGDHCCLTRDLVASTGLSRSTVVRRFADAVCGRTAEGGHIYDKKKVRAIGGGAHNIVRAKTRREMFFEQFMPSKKNKHA